MYAKINDKGYPEFFRGRHVKADGQLFINPTKEQMRALGYKPLLQSELPSCSEDKVLSISYVDSGDYIEEKYTLIGG